jgi:hypothetical protein
MQITISEETGTFKLTPVDPEDSAFLAVLADGIDPLKYSGRTGAHPRDPYHRRMILMFREKDRKVAFGASTDQDEESIRQIRDAVYLSNASITFLGASDAGFAFFVTRCKHCNTPVIKPGECHWRTCAACREKCAHEYHMGHLIGGNDDTPLSEGEYCKKCGLGKPDTQITPAVSKPGLMIF